jgi:tetratricopeptide (TPR) repeat protein
VQKRALEALQQASALFAAGRLEEARRACRKLLEMRPDLAEAHVLLGAIQGRGGDAARADESLRRALRLRPGWSEAHLELTLGDLLGGSGQYAQAETCYRTALQRQPGLAEAREHLLLALLAQRRVEEMEAVAREGLALHPGAKVFARQLGVALWWQGRHEEALAQYRFAGDRFSEANALLSLGRYAEGWEAYRARPTRPAAGLDDPRSIAPLKGKRLRIVREQGLGDEIFFLRFAPALRANGHRLFVSCDRKLEALATAFVDGVNASEPADFTLASGDLALASGQDMAPSLVFTVDPQRRAAMAERLRAFGAPPYLAVTWRAGVLPDEGFSSWTKYVPVELLGGALRPIDARVVSVQRRAQPDEARRFGEALGREVLDLGAVNDDLRDALALLSLVEEYVGVSNTNMHLRAGLERASARVLVATPAEWRWGIAGRSTPWFAGFTLYRAVRGPDWSQALADLAADLAAASQQN